jgi:hypothetical protein
VGSGTAVVALRAPDVLVAAVDSEENYLLYQNGSSTLEHRTVCKVAQPGPFFAIVAGITHGTNGFDALAEATQAWHNGDSLDMVAANIREAIPRTLVPLLESLYAADSEAYVTRYRGQAAVQLLLLGAENGSPQARIVEFVETGVSSSVSLSVRESGCPHDCTNPRAAWFLGTHGRIDESVRANSRLIGHVDEPSLDRLISLEYEERPDIVGGPVSIVKVGRSGAALVREGACRK